MQLCRMRLSRRSTRAGTPHHRNRPFSFNPGMPGPWGVEVAPNSSERVPLSQCPYDKTHARECRVHWRPLLLSSVAFTAFLNAGNLYTGYWYRYETTHGKWFQRWIDSDLWMVLGSVERRQSRRWMTTSAIP